MNVFEKLQTCRVELQEMKLKKSGKNKFSNFDYFELKDFLPAVNSLFLKYKLFSNFSLDDVKATLAIVDIEKEENPIIFTTKIADLDLKGCNKIQALGGMHTYLKRYLYLNALEIVEADLFDSISGCDDNYIYKGLSSCATCEETELYWKTYKEKVTDINKFKSAYASHYKSLKEKTNEHS